VFALVGVLISIAGFSFLMTIFKSHGYKSSIFSNYSQFPIFFILGLASSIYGIVFAAKKKPLGYQYALLTTINALFLGSVLFYSGYAIYTCNWQYNSFYYYNVFQWKNNEGYFNDVTTNSLLCNSVKADFGGAFLYTLATLISLIGKNYKNA